MTNPVKRGRQVCFWYFPVGWMGETGILLVCEEKRKGGGD